MNPGGLKIALERIGRESEAKTGFLDLGGLGLTALPKELFKLIHLRRLNLGVGYNDEYGRPQEVEERFGPNIFGNNVGRLTQLAKLESLFLSNTGLTDAAKISAIAGLRELDCSQTWVRDLAPLRRLPKLQFLDCSDTELNDLTSLHHMSALQSLVCTGLEVNDLTPLKELPSLQSIDFSSTRVSDLTPLKNLPNLQSISCGHTPVHNLAPLKYLPSLQSLDCAGTHVSDLAPIKGLRNLRSLDCKYTRVKDLAPLKGLPNLRSLDCRDTRVNDLAPLKNSPNLQSISCSLTQVRDLTPLKGLLNLESIDCAATRVSNLKPLKGLVNLQTLDCKSTRVSNLEPLKGLTNLRSLNCWGTRLSSLGPLKDLTNLRSLDCSETSVSDLTPLMKLRNLQSLDCMWTQVGNLAPLKSLPNLQSLDCRGTPLSDLTPLKGLPNLQSLCCRETRVSDLTPLTDLPNLQSLDCSGCRLSATPNEFWMKSSLVNVVLSRTALRGIPAEVLSQYANDNCLAPLRAHLQDLEFGQEPMPDVKLMVLGNGRVGKTQICRQLRGEPYDEDVESTHGIIVTSAPLPGAKRSKRGRLQIWDFGGQDIYHGTHALFMRSRAIFAAVWTPEAETALEHRHGDFMFRNQPLSYWLEYIRHFGGADSPTLIVQTRCDQADDEKARPPASNELIDAFKPPPKIMHYSAKKNRGRASLNDALSQSVEWLKKKEGIAVIGKGRAKVKRMIEEMRDADTTKPPRERLHRTISNKDFLTLCGEAGGISEPRQLLAYLHNAGTIFYREGLFDNRIIIDQGWVLEAIYAVLHREKCIHKLLRQNGRFTRSDLAEWIWDADGHAVEEQELFISMMQSCGVCFQYRAGSYDGRIEAEYIAPEFLPDKPESEIAQKWAGDRPTERADFGYHLLIPALIRGILARIGGQAGLAATYWRNGVYLYETSTGSRGLIEQTMTGPWQGRITVQTQRGRAALLLKRLAKIVGEEENRIGIRSTPGQAEPPRDALADDVARGGEKQASAPSLKFAQEPVKKPEYFVSYAWGDDTPEGRKREDAVNRICEGARRRKITVLRDKDVMHFGDSIPKFMKRLVAGDRVIVVLSDKYLKSPYCMYELYEIWRRCKDDTEFLKQVRVFTLPDAKILSVYERTQRAAHWKDETSRLEELIEHSGYDILGQEDYKQYKLMKDFSRHIGDILYTVATTLLPRNFEDFASYAFD